MTHGTVLCPFNWYYKAFVDETGTLTNLDETKIGEFVSFDSILRKFIVNPGSEPNKSYEIVVEGHYTDQFLSGTKSYTTFTLEISDLNNDYIIKNQPPILTNLAE